MFNKGLRQYFFAGIFFLSGTYCYPQEHTNSAKVDTNSVVSTGSAGISQFVLDYTAIDHTQKDDSGYTFEVIELFEHDKTNAADLERTWQEPAALSCNAAEDAKLCRRNFYIAHWDEINRQIKERIRRYRNPGTGPIQ